MKGKWWLLFIMSMGILLAITFGKTFIQVQLIQQTTRAHLSKIPQDYERLPFLKGKPGGFLVASIEQAVKSFNPLTQQDSVSAMVTPLLFAGLLQYDPEQQTLKTALAKHYIVQEGCKYTFTIRQGLQWSDGQAFSVEDVLFTFDLLFAKNDNGQPKWLFPNPTWYQFATRYKGLTYKKLDKGTFFIEIPTIAATFLEDLSHISILPKHKLETYVQDGSLLSQWQLSTAVKSPQAIVGMGPFCIKSFRPGERLTLVPNPYYWKVDAHGQRLPYIEAYITQFVTHTAVRTLLFGSGQTDAAPISFTDLSWIQKQAVKQAYTLYNRGANRSLKVFWFNRELADPHKKRWFNELRFRQAILYGLNRKIMIETNFWGHGEICNSFINASNRIWYHEVPFKYDYDPERARQLLQIAGFKWDNHGHLWDAQNNPVQFDILCDTPENKMLLLSFQSDMAALGIQVRIHQINRALFLEKIQKSGDYESALMDFHMRREDPQEWAEIFASAGRLHYGALHSNEKLAWKKEIDNWLEQQSKTTNSTLRKQIWDQIQETLNEQIPWMPLCSVHHFTGIKNKWQNVRVPPNGNLLWNVEEIWEQP